MSHHAGTERVSMVTPCLPAHLIAPCLRYRTDRPGQLDYPTALDPELPIVSGEIESAHRYIIPHRSRKLISGSANCVKLLPWIPDNLSTEQNG